MSREVLVRIPWGIKIFEASLKTNEQQYRTRRSAGYINLYSTMATMTLPSVSRVMNSLNPRSRG